LNIDASRVPTNGERPSGSGNAAVGTAVYGNYYGRAESVTPEAGRWPANVLHDGSEEVTERFPDTRSRGNVSKGTPRPRGGSIYFSSLPTDNAPHHTRGDSGSAARFFYCAKASTSERNAGLDHLPSAESEAAFGTVQDGRPHTSEDYRYSRPARRNPHPTVKPIALTEYLARLLLPPPRDTPRRILIPFAGSGSEIIGAIKAGWDDAVGIEREEEYATIAHARIAHHTTQPTIGGL